MIKGIRDFLTGLKEGYPLCCIISYCLGNTAGKSGVVYRSNDKYDCFVPCWIHKKSKHYYTYRDSLIFLNNGVLPLLESNFSVDGSLKFSSPPLIVSGEV